VFQHHVTRSLRRFNVSSPGSSPCWLDHCVSTPCDSITAAVLITIALWFFALLARSLRFNTMRLDHCGDSTALWFFTLGSFSASFSSVFSFSALWFFAPLAPSLRFNTM
jgi:hypothetical protein